MLIVHDKATRESWEMPTDAEARKFCDARWPNSDYAFAYLRDMAVDNAPEVLNDKTGEAIILSVVKKVPEDYEGTVPTYGHVVSVEYDITEVWADAMYFGQLADEIEEDLDDEDEDDGPQAA